MDADKLLIYLQSIYCTRVLFVCIVCIYLYPHLGSSASQNQTLVLAGLAFSSSLDELERSSSPGHGHFLCVLQENSLFYGC